MGWCGLRWVVREDRLFLEGDEEEDEEDFRFL
jgi:hypothetical protein